MKRLAVLALVPALAMGGDSNSSVLSWIAGCWVTPDSSAQEVWVVESERSLAGFGVSITDNKIAFYEVLSIKQSEEGSWIYTAHPSGQSSASFVAVEIDDSSVVFENSEHDYPQEIRYKREGRRLHATVSLIGGVNPNSFEKVACE